MKQTELKTIDINAKEWFDKANGNSYFSANICLNYGMPDQENIYLPYQYGYGNHYEYEAAVELDKLGYISLEKYNNGSCEALWQYCDRKGIIKRTNKQTGCKKRDL
jgi:hypothetical protein